MGELGHGRCADPGNEDRSGLLACFHPDAGSTARVLLHPSLTFVACRTAYHDALAATFLAGVDARVVTAGDLALFEPGAPAPTHHPGDVAAQITQVHSAVVQLAGGQERAALREERARLERERAEMAASVEVPPIVDEVRGALRDYELELWAAQRRIESSDTPGPDRLIALLASVGVPDDAPLDDRARHWLAEEQLRAHYARQHLDALDARIAELDALDIELAPSTPLAAPARPGPTPDSPLPTATRQLLRWIAAATPEPLLVLVDVVHPRDTELLDALLDASEGRRVVYVTGDVPLLRLANLLPADLAAVRDPLVTPRTDSTPAPAPEPTPVPAPAPAAQVRHDARVVATTS